MLNLLSLIFQPIGKLCVSLATNKTPFQTTPYSIVAPVGIVMK
jgi:hypothetical protein